MNIFVGHISLSKLCKCIEFPHYKLKNYCDVVTNVTFYQLFGYHFLQIWDFVLFTLSWHAGSF